MGRDTTGGRRISAVERAFGIIDYLLKNDGTTLSELADELGLAKSTTHTYLATLINQGYVIQSDGTYRLSFRFLEIGEDVRNKIEIIDVIRRTLSNVINEVGGIAWFIVEENGNAVFIEKETGDDAVQPYGHIGRRTTLHDIAGGKAILAHLPEKRVKGIISEDGLRKKTERTITNQEDLFTELKQIRQQGYAINNGENLEGWRAIASPIIHKGNVLGSIAASGPEHRMRGKRFDETVPDIIVSSSNEVSLHILSR
jgi:IclR family transcriptional regulator, acetate operon repressor